MSACKTRYSGVDILASKLICGVCGSFYSPKVWHSADQYRRIIYQCGHKYKGCRCSTLNLTAETIKDAFVNAFNEMVFNKNEIISNLRENTAISSNMQVLISQRDAAKDEMAFHADIIESLIAENARIAQDQTEYNKKYQLAMERYEAAKSHYEELMARVAEEHRKQRAVESFIKNVRNLGVISEFDEDLWGLLVESVTVYSKDDIRVEFKK
ncbi:MAG: zinc ribbon domain-containing protein [Oscillospiraceae bacterium]|nr:zinc ribbon domain-containing protein [Oscillospiraceae bacterium]